MLLAGGATLSPELLQLLLGRLQEAQKVAATAIHQQQQHQSLVSRQNWDLPSLGQNAEIVA